MTHEKPEMKCCNCNRTWTGRWDDDCPRCGNSKAVCLNTDKVIKKRKRGFWRRVIKRILRDIHGST